MLFPWFLHSRALDLLEACIIASLFPLTLCLLVSGLDDLILDAACAFQWLCRTILGRKDSRIPTEAQLAGRPEKRVAIFVPLWGEHQVIGRMLGHNIAAIRYQKYDFFVGAYPNDEPTLQAVSQVAARFKNVHLAICPHDGPTSKADCLNWIYQRMLLYEEEHDAHFEVVITHDAEDLIHPESLGWINFHIESYDMVQIPVLPLPTPLRQWTHGIYCDEFGEYQTRDMPARSLLGGFTPSNGVGTAYSRRGLEMLAESESNQIFDPACLTEDYENGLRLHRLGCPQLFVPVCRFSGSILATREYFPHTFRGAVKQRTRWVMGIALQSWERHGWSGGLGQAYWFWRDRKGLIGNPVSMLTNLIFLYGVTTWSMSRAAGVPWTLSRGLTDSLILGLLQVTLTMQMIRMGVRACCAARYYGWVFSLGVPIRIIYANLINTVATIQALWQYGLARLRHEPLIWLKTEHAYPSRSALLVHKRRLGEILTGSGYLSQEDLASALASQPVGLKLGQHLLQLGTINEEDLYEALSLQQSLPAGWVNPLEVRQNVARSLPAHIVREWQVVPFKVACGNLWLAAPELPNDALGLELRKFTSLEIQFHLVTKANFDELKKQLL